MQKKIVIIGGMSSGIAVAMRLRRMDAAAEIIVIERGKDIAVANWGLSYYLGGVIKDKSKLILQAVANLRERFSLDIRLEQELTSVDAENKSLLIQPKIDASYRESFTHLVLAPGAQIGLDHFSNLSSDRISAFRSFDDADRLKRLAEENGFKHVAISGGGFLAIEVVENLRKIGLAVTLIESANHLLADDFDHEMANFLRQELLNHQVDLILNTHIQSVDDMGSKLRILLANKEELSSDFILLLDSIKPSTGFLKESSIKLDAEGFISINALSQTNYPYIYALGDATLVSNRYDSKIKRRPLAGALNRQIRTITDHICNEKATPYEGALATSILKMFDLSVARVGLTEAKLIANHVAYQSSYLHPSTHEGFYPGATSLTLKILAHSESGELLGAQIFGYESVDKLIDTIATTMHFKGTITDLAQLELSYAAPYSTAKSPINQAGSIALATSEERIQTTTLDKALQLDKSKQQLLDVRDDIEVATKKLPESLHIPLNELRKGLRLNELDKNKEILVYCAVGMRGYMASRYLMSQGYQVKNIAGGIKMALGYEPTTQKKSEVGVTPVENKAATNAKVIEIDLTGLQCPGPLMELKKHMDSLEEGAFLRVQASDPGFFHDVKGWASSTGHELCELTNSKGIIQAQLRKRSASGDAAVSMAKIEDQTIVLFSNDLDKAIAAFIIANGAAAMGKKVSIFFTFWGLSVIKAKQATGKVGKKGFMEQMFAMMLPSHSGKLPLSKMDMAGMGPRMIRYIMKKKQVLSLETLMDQAAANGVEFIACTMSMDIMGFKAEELRSDVSLGGVGYYLNKADTANKNLFI